MEIIRRMTIGDYEELYALWMSCTGMGLNDLDDSKEGIAGFLNRNPDTCFIAADKDRIIGAIMSGNDGRRGYIYHTSVHPDHRKRGVARRLVEKVMEALKGLGINKVALVVFERNREGNAFWERTGFSAREDLVYRDKAIRVMHRVDT